MSLFALLVYIVPVIAGLMALAVGSLALRPVISEIVGILRRTPS